MSARGSTLTVQTSTSFFVEECCSCGVLFAMMTELHADRLRDKQSFYCPNGHSQVYRGKTHEQELRELRQARDDEATRARALADQLDAAKLAAKRQKAEAARLARRAAAGVCPCCQRSFVQLARHMKTKHPEQATS